MLEAYGSKYLGHPLIWPETVEFRLYQKRIAEAASERNTLVILPTALGKTVISAIVAANVLYNYRDSKVLVMAPTRPLVSQHRNSFLRLLKLREKDIGLLTGKTPPEHRRLVWEGEARIVFSTPQVVRNDLMENRLSLEKYGLVVFDECHRAVKEYAYTEIAQLYVFQARYPLILGMTASPGSNLERVLEVCRNLYIEGVEYRSEEDPDVKPYIQSIEVEWKRVNLPKEYLDCRSQIRAMLDNRIKWLCNKGIIKRRLEYVSRKSLIEAGNELRFMLEESIEEERGKIFTAIVNQSIALTLFHMQELLETQGLHTLRAFLNKVELEKREKRSHAILVSDPEYWKLKTLVENSSTEHPKAELLKQLVKEQLEEKPSSRMLVFTQYRDTASHLVEELDVVSGVKADRFVGQASRLMDKGLTQEEQAERIRMLEGGELNVLVATSIAEEGLDIPAVDHVIFYEPIPSEIRYIQRRGRTGRKAPGKVTILAANESFDMIYLYASRRKTEIMRKIAENINLSLQPFVRKSLKPAPNPLTQIEIKMLEEEARQIQAEPEVVKAEVETIKEFNNRVERTSRILYMKLLERGGSGADMEQIAADMEYEGVSLQVLKAAIRKMVKDGLVMELGQSRYVAASAAKASRQKVYEVTVEKIYPNIAVVLVNDKWRARLTPEEYNGPKALIKKNSRFKADADLYRMRGTLCIRINEVVEVVD
ncbi:DEAD/DEAH box helicase family protein [Candidatus Bathyarchaeota archaeon]|nr:DEAD/DEAH box helicase family protein [Candidatus Bathyarchaeota archaeon]